MFPSHDRPFPRFAWAADGPYPTEDDRSGRGGPGGPRSRRRGHRHGDDDAPRGPGWVAMGRPDGGDGGGRDGGGRGDGPGRGRGGPRGRRGMPPFGPPFGPGFGPPRGGPFGRPGGPRARRGDIRLAVLRLLGEAPMHGYQIIQELGTRTGGMWNPSPGSVYPTLSALEDQGLVRAEEVDGRRVFHLTDAGRTWLAGEAGRPAPWDEVSAGSGDLPDLRDTTIGVMEAARQVGSAGTPGQVARALALLRDTRRKLYQILAEDPEEPQA